MSALVDGELDAGEAREVEKHVRDCAACRDAERSFLALRREIVSHAPAADPAAQNRVLSAVLSSKTGRTSASATHSRLGGAGGRRETSNVRTLLAGLLGARGLTPAMSAAAALLLVAAALGLLVYLNSRPRATNVNLATRDDAPAAQQDNRGDAPLVRQGDPRPTTTPTDADEKRRERAAGVVNEKPEPRPEVTAGGKRPRRVVVVTREPKRRATRAVTPDASAPGEVAGRATPQGNNQTGARPSVAAVDSSPASGVASATTSTAIEPRRGAEGAGALDAARHAEQAQMLLRSFRNARLADGGMAYERARSKKLLYRNIVLRREAATRRDASVAQALDRLEPILLDIANLPDDPAEEEVNSIRERVRKKNLVVMLQASAAGLTSSPARRRSY